MHDRPLGATAAQLRRAMDAGACVQAKRAIGFPGPDEMAAQIQSSVARLEADRAALAEEKNRLDRCRVDLDGAVRNLLEN